MSNKDLTDKEKLAYAQAGDKDCISWLWNKVDPDLRIVCRREYGKHRSLCNIFGLTVEDLYQEGYFSFQVALEHFATQERPEKSVLTEFTNYLKVTHKYRIVGLISNRYGHGGRYYPVETEDGKVVYHGGDMLQHTISLDGEVPGKHGDESNSITFVDFVVDPEAEKAIQSVEERMFTEKLREHLDEAMKELTPLQQDVIRSLYFEGIGHEALITILKVSKYEIKKQELLALYEMRKSDQLRSDYFDLTDEVAWSTTRGSARYQTNNGSPVERAVEQLDSVRKKNMDSISKKINKKLLQDVG